MNRNLIYILVVLVMGSFVFSACSQDAVGKRIISPPNIIPSDINENVTLNLSLIGG